MKPVLPHPVGPTMPTLEKLSEIKDKPHDWDENEDVYESWGVNYCHGYVCKDCGEHSECVSETDIHANNTECLRHQAEERNDAKIREYEKALEIYEHQLLYYMELKEKWGYQ